MNWISPMLATLTEDYFSDPSWIFEHKLDGERVMTYVKGGKPSLYSRNQILLNGNYPELVDAFEGFPDMIVDGEVVAADGRFASLQRRMQTRNAEDARRSGVRIAYHLFDVLFAGGRDLRSVPLQERKDILRGAIAFKPPLRFVAHRVRRGEAYLDEACKKGWEGLIAKRAASPYISGRSKEWLKFKCVNEQEFVVVGFTAPTPMTRGYKALLVGYYDEGTLRYGGKVGTGGSVQMRDQLGEQLRKLETGSPPVAGRVREKDVHWVRPKMVVEVAFTEFTPDGKLRHPRLKGVRRDKKASDVVRES